MEFDLNQLNREWIAGISGANLCAKVDDIRARLQQLTAEEAAQGVLITEKDPIAFAAAFFAAVSLDIPIVLGNPNWGQREWRELAELVSPTITFGRGFTGEDRRAKDNSTTVFTASTSSGIESSEAPTRLQPSTILIPTGGSTGGVKLAIHTWDSLGAACSGVQSFLGGGPITSCCVLPLYHVSGLMQLLRAYHSGGYIRFDESEVADACISHVPTQLQRALSDPERTQKLATARAIFVGGAPMNQELIARVRALRLPIVPVYGMTETAAMVAAIPVTAFLANAAAGAQPMGDACIEIDSDGRICIQSPALFKGYHGRAPIDLSHGYVTDDEGRLDESGDLHVIGRMDRLINSGGEKIDPKEVESAVSQLYGVEEVLAVGLPDDEWGQKLVVYYTGAEATDWKERLITCLATYKIPKEMIFVHALPLDAKGKFASNRVNVGASLVKTVGHEHQAATVFTTSTSSGIESSEAPTKKILPVRKTQNLRKGRSSNPGARYFITICTRNRKQSLLNTAHGFILNTWRLQHTDHDYTFHCGTCMPDHIHFLFTLGERLSLGQCIIKFKAKTKSALEAVGLNWQRDFYDHQLRADDALESFAKYTFLNPYRKSLLSTQAGWPHWHLSLQYQPEFIQYLNAAGAPPEPWIDQSIGAEELIENDLKWESCSNE